MRLKKKFITLVIPTVFLVISILTIHDYGISWDEPIHFFRGQAYLHYFLTGKLNYSDLKGTRSYYQNDSLRGEYFLKEDSGHPPVNGELSALFNLIFYQKLGWVGDIEGYQLFNIFISSILVLVISIFAYQTYGLLASIVASLTIATYPLFFGEAHFNIKDPAESAFMALAIYSFWKGVEIKKSKWLIISAVFSGLALGTKFNIIFLPFILLPYFLVVFYPQIKKSGFNVFSLLKAIPKSFKISLVIYPLITLAIFYLFWPFLWQSPFFNLLKVIKYYKEIGTGFGYQAIYYQIGKINTYPAFWILITTYPLVLFLGILGIYFSFKERVKNRAAFLWLLWFLVPVVRVSLPDTAIYGGVRQIMEYMSGLSLLAGLGAAKIFQKITNQKLKIVFGVLVVLGFIPNLSNLYSLHPNENVYFNSLIGGLAGAKRQNVPYWGNSFGNAYYPAVKWINTHAYQNAQLALIQGTGTNIPQTWLRKDITLNNLAWSGIKRQGEYLVELTHMDPVRVYPYPWDYVNKFLEPVYEVKVQGVAIAKVWQNDLEHTKKEYRKKEVLYRGGQTVTADGSSLQIDLGQRIFLTRLLIHFKPLPGCQSLKGEVDIYNEAGRWLAQEDSLPVEQVTLEEDPRTTFEYFFPGEVASKIKILTQSSRSCLLNEPKVKVYTLESN